MYKIKILGSRKGTKYYETQAQFLKWWGKHVTNYGGCYRLKGYVQLKNLSWSLIRVHGV